MNLKPPETVADLAIWIVAVAAVAALVYIAIVQFGIAVPAWVVQVFWVLVVAVVIILAIRFIAGFGGKG